MMAPETCEAAKMAVEMFFSTATSQSCMTSKNCDAVMSDSIKLLSGPPASGKTSLLMQFALNEALRSSRDVVFICKRQKLATKPPFLSQGIDPSADILQRIQFKYVDDEEGLKKYFAAFHLYGNQFPVAVVVDDFGDFFNERRCQERYGNNPRGRDLAMVRVLALCRSASKHANKTASCHILLSDTHQGDSPRLFFIYKRWISSLFTISGDGRGDGSGSFFLKSTVLASGDGWSFESKRRIARYSIALQSLVLKEITEEAEEQ